LFLEKAVDLKNKIRLIWADLPGRKFLSSKKNKEAAAKADNKMIFVLLLVM